MKTVIAIDSLKGSLTSMEAGKAIKNAILTIYPDSEVIIKPLADGGEGTVEALVSGLNGITKKTIVTGPLFEKREAIYGQLTNSQTAIIEMSAAAGITLIPHSKLNPLHTTTYGVGEIIGDAIKDGCKNFIIGIGGSATNDCGIGMLAALGYRFLDVAGAPVIPNGAGVSKIAVIDDSQVLPELKSCQFKIACDVNNPLCGPNGASAVYGPQKGADEKMAASLDKALYQFSELVKQTYQKDNREIPGTGAAGGLGYAFLTFLDGVLESGIDIILKETALEEEVKDADFVITGEGRLDFQTAMGKAPIGVAKLAKKHGAIVLAFAGCTTQDAEECNSKGIDAYFDIVNTAMTLEEAMNPINAASNMTTVVKQVFRLIKAGGRF